MCRHILKLFVMFSLFLLIGPNRAYVQELNQVMHPEKKVIVQIKYGERDGEFGIRKFEQGDFLKPKAFAFDSDRNIYIADSVHEIPRIQVFNDKGTFLRKIDLKSNRKYPLVVDVAIYEKTLYVLMFRENIQVFSLMGQPMQAIKFYMDYDVKKEWTDALYNPTWLEVDSVGHIYLSTRFGALVKLDAQGAILQKWSNVDHYLNVDGNLFIMDFEKERSGKVVKYSPDGKKLTESTCEALFSAPAKQSCRLPMFIDKNGRMFRKFNDMHVTRYSKRKAIWFGVDLYSDEDGDYYKVDGNGNIYTIKDDLIKYVTSE